MGKKVRAKRDRNRTRTTATHQPQRRVGPEEVDGSQDVLGLHFSERWPPLVDAARAKLQRSISIRARTGQFMPLSYEGSFELTDDELKIELNTKRTAEDAERIAAHEIMHGIVQDEGYPLTAFTNSPFADEHLRRSQLSTQVKSVLHDLVVDQRLAAFGYDMGPHHAAQVAANIRDVRPNTKWPPAGQFRDQELRAILVLLLAQGSAHEQDQLRRVYELGGGATLFEETAAVVEELRALGWETPEKMADSLRRLRDWLGLRGVVFVYDKATTATS